MIEKNLLRYASILILCIGIYVFARPVAVSERIKAFYNNYPIVQYAGEKQLTSRSSLVRIVGGLLIIVGILCFISI
jgi:uncharacterized membrane protein HdeD (DUF308 family)